MSYLYKLWSEGVQVSRGLDGLEVDRRSLVVKKELSQKTMLLILQSIYLPTGAGAAGCWWDSRVHIEIHIAGLRASRLWCLTPINVYFRCNNSKKLSFPTSFQGLNPRWFCIASQLACQVNCHWALDSDTDGGYKQLKWVSTVGWPEPRRKKELRHL